MRIAKASKQMNSIFVRMLALFVLTLLLTSGCATGGKYMTKANRMSEPEQGKALVTFVRPSGFGGAISFGLWDGDTFVGILGPDLCIQYEAVPGEHYFLARAENWSCVKADLAADRHYVIKANPVMGAWKARVALAPVNKSDYDKQGELKKVQKWLARAKPVMPNPQHLEAYTQPRRKQALEAQATFKSGKGRYATLARQDYLPE
jgi:hypothetical protein